MLKLLKYELKESSRQYALAFAAYFAGCLITPLLPSEVKEFVVGILMMALMVMTFSILINCIYTYYTSMFKKPGYLTLTLPVSSKQLVLSKLIGAIIWSFVGMVVLCIGIVAMAIIVPELEIIISGTDLNAFIQAIINNFGEIVQDLISTVIGLASLILSFYFTVTLMHTKYVPKYRALVGIFGYILVLWLGTYLLDISGLNTMMINLSNFGYFIAMNLLELVLAAGFFIGTIYLIENKIELE